MSEVMATNKGASTIFSMKEILRVLLNLPKTHTLTIKK
jgi:hypothetical protein